MCYNARNYNTLEPLITLYNALYMKALRNVLPNFLFVCESWNKMYLGFHKNIKQQNYFQHLKY